jgi:class 3 adenylate cyclase/tetratricopeptide (TPR) repeat protein
MQWRIGPFRLDQDHACLWQGEARVVLRPKTFDLLVYLVEHAGELVTKEDLLGALWPQTVVAESALTVSVSELRKALGETARAPQYIATEHRRGYRFIAPVTPLEPPAPPVPVTLLEPTQVEAPEAPPPLAAERRQLTVLFCDLVDSTRLVGQLDPEDWREVLHAYHQSCAEVVARFEGYVAQYLGDGVLVYFGYPVAHEDDARRAIHVGLRLIDAVADCNTRLESDHGIQLSVRIGIHTGPVVVGHEGEGAERLAIGATPNLAAHLQEFAAPNTVVISAGTHELTQGFFNVEALGAHALQGASQPTALYRVLGDSGLRSRFDVAFARGLTPLVGREQEVGLLLERWERAQRGQGQVILLSGEAGIGKSRLVQVLKERASDQAHTCLECRSLPYLTNSALSPVIDLLQRLWQFEADDTPTTKLAKLEHHLESYCLALDECVPLFGALLSFPVPQSRYAPLVVTPQRQRQKTLEATVTLLLAMAERQPLLFVLEDLHWTDPTTLALLDLLIDQTPTAALGVVLTCRPDFEPTWRHRSYLSELRINRLTPPQIEHIVTHVAGGKQLPEAITTSLEDKSDGVPLHIEEMTKSLLESGYLKAMDGRYELTEALSSLAIPATLQDSLMARLDRLGTAKVVAQYGSVIGRQFSYALLQVVSQLDETMLQRELGRLVEAELLYQKGLLPHATYIFKHALVHDSAYESLLKSSRQQYHQRIAYTLEKQFTEAAENQPELLAYHFAQGNVWEKALAYFSQAAKKATQALATHEALSLYEQALDAAHRVEPPVAPQALLPIHQAKVDLYVITSDYERAWAEGERYLALAQEAGDQMHEGVALVSMGMASILDHHIDQGLTYAQRAIAVTQAADAKEIQAGSHSTAGLALGVLGRLDLAWHEINQAIIVGRDAGAVAHESFALGFAGLMKNWAGEYTEASQLCTQALDIARAHSLLMPHSHTLLFHAFTLVGTGAYDAALVERFVSPLQVLGLAP